MSTDSLPRTSGIYLITCTANNKIYVGSTSNLRKRQHDHFADMRRGAHSNRHLQSACNKYGIDTFTFEVLEYVMPFIRIEREQYWLDKLTPYDHNIGFNIAIRARGDKLSIEHRANISKANMGHIVTEVSRAKMRASAKVKVFTPEHRRNIVLGTKGRVKSEQECKNIANGKSIATWVLTNPNGEVITIKNLVRFCRENGLNRGHMGEVSRGKRKHHKGWKCHKMI